MRRSRGYTRRYARRIKSVKYSNETVNSTGQFEVTDTNNTQQNMVVVAKADIQGTRKCKNFELSMTGGPLFHDDATTDATVDKNIPIIWALVYVPEGTTPGSVHWGGLDRSASLYEPNQNVIMSGVWPANLTSPYKMKTRLARNLNSGDSIYLVMDFPSFIPLGTKKNICINLNYAIAY